MWIYNSKKDGNTQHAGLFTGCFFEPEHNIPVVVYKQSIVNNSDNYQPKFNVGCFPKRVAGAILNDR